MHLARSLLILLLPCVVGAIACHPSPYDVSTVAQDREAALRHNARKQDFLARENAEPRWPIDALLSGHRVHPAHARLRIVIDDAHGEPMFTEYRNYQSSWREAWTNWVKNDYHGCISCVGPSCENGRTPASGVVRTFLDAEQQQTIDRCIAELNVHPLAPRETVAEKPVENPLVYRVHVEYSDDQGHWRVQRDNPGIHVIRRHLAGFMDCVCRLSAPSGDYRQSPLAGDCARIAEAERARAWWPNDETPSNSD